MNYADPPGGKVGEVVAEAVSNTERIMREDLQNFARLVKRGELGGVENQTPGRYRAQTSPRYGKPGLSRPRSRGCSIGPSTPRVHPSISCSLALAD
jgi:hypothetical protein